MTIVLSFISDNTVLFGLLGVICGLLLFVDRLLGFALFIPAVLSNGMMRDPTKASGFTYLFAGLGILFAGLAFVGLLLTLSAHITVQ